MVCFAGGGQLRPIYIKYGRWSFTQQLGSDLSILFFHHTSFCETTTQCISDSKIQYHLLHMTTLSICGIWCRTRNKASFILWSLWICKCLLWITLLAKTISLSTIRWLLRTINWLPHCNPILSLLRKSSWPNLIPNFCCKKIIVCSKYHSCNRQQTPYDEQPRANDITVVSSPLSTITIWTVQTSSSHKWCETIQESNPVPTDEPMNPYQHFASQEKLPLCIYFKQKILPQACAYSQLMLFPL